jgi:hypothetical protein
MNGPVEIRAYYTPALTRALVENGKFRVARAERRSLVTDSLACSGALEGNCL